MEDINYFRAKVLLADDSVIIPIIHVWIRRVPARYRRNAVVTRLSTSDPAIAVVIIHGQGVLCGGLRRRLCCR